MSMPKQQDLLNRMTFNVFGKGTTMPKTGNIVIKDIYIAIQQNNTEAVDRLFKETKSTIFQCQVYILASQAH